MSDSNLGPVFLRGEGTSWIDDRTDCPGQLYNVDLTRYSASLRVGASYTLRYNVTTCGEVAERSSNAWIDWNGDMEWEDRERLGTRVVTAAAWQVVELLFTVPEDLTYRGPTLLRVMVQEGNLLGPCSWFTFGGTKDFAVNLLDPVSPLPPAPPNPPPGGRRAKGTGFGIFIGVGLGLGVLGLGAKYGFDQYKRKQLYSRSIVMGSPAAETDGTSYRPLDA